MRAVTISVGSGKGGTGKSVVIANLASVLARRGFRVCLADLDVGGADAHVLFGLFKPKATLTDFLTRKVPSLEEVAETLEGFHGLRLLAGTGETLKTANMPYATKQRLIRNLAGLEADIVLVDVGAGTHYHALDFFMLSDLQICVATPDPTAVLDLYRFLKLAAVRKALSAFLSYDEVTKAVSSRDFRTIEDVFELAEETREGAKEKAQTALDRFHPTLVMNQVKKAGDIHTRRLREVLARYVGMQLPELGSIPEDPAVRESVRAYLPVCDAAPASPAAVAINAIADALITQIEDL